MKDGERFCQPGCLNILVVPIKPTRKSVYKSSFQALSSFTQIKGSEVPGFSTFHPPPLSPTSHTIHIQYHTSPNTIMMDAQVAFNDQYHALIGIVDCPSHDSLDAANEAFTKTIEALPAALKPHIQRCWAFQPRDKDRAATNPSSRLALVEDSAFYLNTLVADIVGSILSWFADTAGERRKNDGRQSKLYGDLYLMSGRLKESLSSYNDSLSQMRAPVDSFHQASAIECQGIAQTLLYWAKIDDIPSHTAAELPWSAIQDKLNSALAVYMRLLHGAQTSHSAPPSTSSLNLNNVHHTPSNPDLMAVRVYIRACLRLAKFLLTVWACGGLNEEALNVLVKGGSPVFLETQPDRDLIVEHADKMPHLPRSQISMVAESAHGSHLFQLNQMEQLKVLIALIQIQDSIGYARKAAYYRQEVVVICADLLKASQKESVAQASDSRLVVKPLTGSNESLVKILDQVCDVYGIDTHFGFLYKDGEADEAGEDVRDEDLNSELELERTFKWINVQRDFLRDATLIVENIGDYHATIKYSALLLRYYHSTLSAAEQVRLVRTMLAALDVLRRRSTTPVELAFWLPDPLLSLELISQPEESLPFIYTSHRSSMQKLANAPSRRSVRIARSLSVQNESVEIAATLHNPYRIPLELQGVELITSGVRFESDKIDVLLAPSSYQTLRLKGVVLSTGQLTVLGCRMRTSGTVNKDIILPLSTADEEKRKSKARDMRLQKRSKMKSSGLSSIPSIQRQSMSSRSSTIPSITESRRPTLTSGLGGVKGPQYIEVAVVPSLPTLVVAATNLSHHALMLYSGESTTLKLTLENTSAVDVNFVDVKFSDNSTEALLSAIEEQQGTMIDTHEMEYTLAHEPIFRPREDTSAMHIPARGKAVVEIDCHGRMGCSQGVIFIEYGCKRGADTNSELYARQLTYPLLMTVQQTLDVQQISVLPFEGTEAGAETKEYFGLWPTSPIASQPMTPTHTAHANTQLPLIEQSQLLQNTGKDAHEFLFIVDIRNSFGTPFEVVLERIRTTQEEDEDADADADAEVGVCRLVQPGSTARLVLPVRRMKLSDTHSTQRIPSICERQFTVSQASLPLEKERAMREIFWYSQELYKSVHLSWREPGSTTDRPRGGDLSLNLRKHKLSSKMLRVVKVDTIDVDLSTPKAWDRIELGKEALMKLRVSNLAERTVKLRYRFEVSVEKCLIVKGPEWTYLDAIESGKECVRDVNILPLSRCRVDVRVVVQEVYADDEMGTSTDWDQRVRDSVERLEECHSRVCIIDIC